MITVRPQKNLKNAKEYFHQHLRRGDYHSQGQTLEGQWYGKGVERLAREVQLAQAARFGPGQAVTEEAFLRLCDNLHPLTGQKLTVRHRKDRRVFYDFTISAPKSVSVMALTMGDARILAAHDRACRAAMRELELVAATRIRKGRAREQRPTGEIVAAAFRHDASRALDPQLHTHLVVFNATWDEVEQRWKALEPSTMFDHTKFLTEVYRAVLAADLLKLGYKLRQTTNGFQIEGVSEPVLQRFSKRSRAILIVETQAVKDLNARRKQELEEAVTKSITPEQRAIAEQKLSEFVPLTKLTNTGRALVAHATRQRKQTDLSSSELAALQREQLTGDELGALEKLIPGADPETAETDLTPAEALTYACDHLFERRSVVAEKEILTEGLAYACGQVSLAELRAELRNRPELIRANGSVTTKTALREEQRMIALVNHSLGRYLPLNPQFATTDTLSGEQQQVVKSVLNSADGVFCLRGGAGTGKTVTLKEVVRGMEAVGLGVVTIAPSAAAVDVLREEGFADAQTVQTLLVNEAKQERLKNQVLLVDEAGLLSNPQMLGLLELVHRNRCRLLLSGDRRQHNSVEAGDALRILEQHSALHTVELQTIRRQTHEEYREAIAEIARGQAARAFVRLQRMGAVEEVAKGERYVQLGARYVASLKAGKTALIITPTWRESEITTEQVRQELKQAGRLQPTEKAVSAHLPLQWTEAQKRDLRNYEPGQVLLFHRATRDFGAGEWGEVERRDTAGLRVRKPNGKVVCVTKKQSHSFEVARPHTLNLAPGEQLLIQGNRRDAGLLNGQIVTVKQVEPDGSLSLADGRTVPAAFRTFNYGYCVTSPKSQGKTVDHVYVAVDAESGQSVNVKQFYVSASRGREQIHIYTDDLEWLREQVLKSGTRKAAIELVDEMAAHPHAGEQVHPPAADMAVKPGLRA